MSQEKMSASREDERSPDDRLLPGNLRALLEQIEDPELLDEVSRTAQELAELARAQRTAREGRLAAISNKVLEIFPDLKAKVDAALVHLSPDSPTEPLPR